MQLNAINNSLSEAVLDTGLLDELLSELGLNVQGSEYSGPFRCRCPIHGGRGRNLVITTGGDTLPIYWHCYSGQCHDKFKPSLLGLVRGVLSAAEGKEVSVAAAIKFVKAFLSTAEPCHHRPRRPRLPPNLLRLSRQQVRGQLIIPSPYFLARGMSPEVLEVLDVGHSAKLNRSVVPIYDDEGETCIGFIARSESPVCDQCGWCHLPAESCSQGEPKWLLPPGFPKGQLLYNFATTRAASPYLFLVEGPADVFRLAEAGQPAVAILGSDLSTEQARKLAQLCPRRRILIALDNDEAGIRGAKNAAGKLGDRGVHCLKLNGQGAFKDIGELPADEVKRWVHRALERSGLVAPATA